MAGTTEKRPAVERAKPPEMMAKVGNPIFGWLLRSPLHGLVDEHLMLLHFRGRKTGRGYTLPVGRRDIDGRLGVLTSSGWRANFRGGAPVEVTLEGERRRGHAELAEDPEEVARLREAHRGVRPRTGRASPGHQDERGSDAHTRGVDRCDRAQPPVGHRHRPRRRG